LTCNSFKKEHILIISYRCEKITDAGLEALNESFKELEHLKNIKLSLR